MPHTLHSGLGGLSVSVLMTRAAERSRKTFLLVSIVAWRRITEWKWLLYHFCLAEIVPHHLESL